MKQHKVARVESIDQLCQQEPISIDCVNWSEYPGGPETTFRIGRLGDDLCILYAVKEDNPRAVNEHDFDPVWQDSCVEFFCQVPGDHRYLNFEFNSRGIGLVAKRKSRNEEKEDLPAEQMSQIAREVKLGDGNWELLLRIPLSLIVGDNKDASQLRANFYKCGDLTDEPHYLSWNPIPVPSPDFHRPECFGILDI